MAPKHAGHAGRSSTRIKDPVPSPQTDRETALAPAPYFNHVEIQWFAPFLSGGGYSSEAMAFAGVLDSLDSVTSIEARKRSQEAAATGATPYRPKNTFKLPFSVSFSMTHHGDSPSQSHIDSFTAHDRQLLEAHFNHASPSSGGMDGHSVLPEELDHDNIERSDLVGGDIVLGGGDKKKQKRVLQIVICHSEPGAWHAPQPKYHTQRCPPVEHTSRRSKNKKNRGKQKASRSASGAAAADEIRYYQYRIGRTMFETDSVPSGWPSRLEYMNEVWVPTTFASDIFGKAMGGAGGSSSGMRTNTGTSTIQVVQEPVDTEFYQPIDYDSLPADSHILGRLPSTLRVMEPHIAAGATIFLFVGKWEERKGIRMLIRAFYAFLSSLDEADLSKKNALLVIVTSAYHSTNQFDREIKKILVEDGSLLKADTTNTGNNKQYVLLTEIPQEHMPHLYSAATALVIPSTGEGWGRPHVESMACGTPVVATAWSGPLSFLTSDNGYPLKVADMQAAAGWEGHRWAKPDEQHLVSILKEIHHEHQHQTGPGKEGGDSSLKHKGLLARKDMVEKYSLSVFADIMAAEVKRIERIAAAMLQEEEEDERMDFGSENEEL